MSEVSFPFEAGTGLNIVSVQWRQMNRVHGMPGVLDMYLNELVMSVGSGLTVNIATGAVFAFGHYYENTATTTLTFAANSSGSLRYDYVVVAFDWVNSTAGLRVLTGTPGMATPPALTQDFTSLYQVPLHVVAVPNAAANILAGDLLPLLDHFAMPNGSMPTGTVIDWVGDENALPSGFVLACGQVLYQVQVPRLAATMPQLSGTMEYGRLDAYGTLIVPDLRGRVTAGPDSMGLATSPVVKTPKASRVTWQPNFADPAGATITVQSGAGIPYGHQDLFLTDWPQGTGANKTQLLAPGSHGGALGPTMQTLKILQVT